LPRRAIVATKEGDLLLSSGVNYLKVAAGQILDWLPIIIDGNGSKIHASRLG
jgi:hypothetical protein